MAKGLDKKRKNADPNQIELIKAVLLGGGGMLYLYEMQMFNNNKFLEVLGYLFIMFASMHLYRYFSNKNK